MFNFGDKKKEIIDIFTNHNEICSYKKFILLLFHLYFDYLGSTPKFPQTENTRVLTFT